MTFLPGVPRAVVRQLRIPADAETVMAWLTDSDRREREWLGRVAARPDIHEPSVSHLANGGLRFDQVQVSGARTTRHVIEDVAIRAHRVDRVLRGEVTSPHFIARGRWVVKERITAESRDGATNVRVRARGRLVGWMPLLQQLGYSDTIWGRFLTEQASQLADFIVAELSGRFPGPPEQPVR